jgi:hypothetical protein
MRYTEEEMNRYRIRTAALLVVVAMAALIRPGRHPVEAKMSAPVIADGDLPHPVRLAQVDWVRYWNARPVPTVLSARPAPSGVSYTVTGWWFGGAVDSLGLDERLIDQPADYDPGNGSLCIPAAAATCLGLDATRRAAAGETSLLAAAALPSLRNKPTGPVARPSPHPPRR